MNWKSPVSPLTPSDISLSRREIMLAAVLSTTPGCASTQRIQAADEDQKLAAIFNLIREDQVNSSPELASELGVDVGARAHLKHMLDDMSAAKDSRSLAQKQHWLRLLQSVNRQALSPTNRVNLDVMTWWIGLAVKRGTRFDYGYRSAPVPFLLSPRAGSYLEVPDFLQSTHAVANSDDAEAYLDRLSAFAERLDVETARFRSDASKGVILSPALLSATAEQMRRTRDGEDLRSSLLGSFEKKLKTAGVDNRYHAAAADIVQGAVLRALNRQIAAVESLIPTAPQEIGAWRFPHGKDYYDYCLEYFNTIEMSADEIHELGRQQVAEIEAQLDALLRKQGLTEGAVGARLQALSQKPSFLLPNTDAGRQQVLALFESRLRDMERRLPQAFDFIPAVPVEVRRMSPDREAVSPGAFYDFAAPDGSRPGIFWVNLRDTAEWPTWKVPTTTYHETVPGHHLQTTTAMMIKGMPEIRKSLFLGAHGEGWALYAEQLAEELGAYENDDAGRIGRLQFLLFRAARLVIDTGLHRRRWTRRQGIDYMMATLGNTETVAASEIDRYLLNPGQATSYKVGHNAILAARERARQKLGSSFAIKGFHTAVIGSGAVPLTVMDELVDAWIKQVGS